MTQSSPLWTPPPILNRIRGAAIGAAVVGIVVCIAGLVASPHMFFTSYLSAFMFWTGISLGSTAFLCLHHLVGGDWGRSLRRPLESASFMIILMAVLFIPIALGASKIYPWMSWTDEDRHLAPHKAVFFTAGFFYVRAAIYFAVWIAISVSLNILSDREDRSTKRIPMLGMVAGPSLAFYGIAITFAAFDWVMSVQPFWYSSMFGLIYVAGQGLSCMSFMVILMSMLEDQPPLRRVLSRGVFNDMGNLLLAFTMLWAYTSFSQWLIIWSGNIRDEVSYFVNRIQGIWGAIILLVLVLHFAIPFLLLLSRDVKSSPKALAKIAVLILVMRMIELCWQVQPAVPASSTTERMWRIILDIAAPLAIGGIWMTLFITRLKARPLIARHSVSAETTDSSLHPEGGLHGHGGAYDAGPNTGGHHA